MSHKHGKPENHGKKKLTKKELKAMNHAKLMAGKSTGSNVVDINAFRQDKDKKAA
jgi:hypothetical protein